MKGPRRLDGMVVLEFAGDTHAAVFQQLADWLWANPARTCDAASVQMVSFDGPWTLVATVCDRAEVAS